MRDATRIASAVLVLVAVMGVVAPVAAAAGPVPTTSIGSATLADGAGVPGAGPATGADAASASGNLQCEYPFTATDATGTNVTVDEEPERIVTLGPSAAQTLWEFGAADKVVGLTNNGQYLDGADEREVVAEGFDYHVETIIGLEPDVVLAPNVAPEDTVKALRDNGVTVYYFEAAENFEDVYDKTERIGELSGECEAGSATATDMRQRVDAIREAVSDEERPGSLYVLGTFTAGDNTFIHDILETAGTTNVAAEAGIDGYAELNDEIVANNSEDIEWLVLEDPPGAPPSGDVWNETTAMQDDQTVALNGNYINQPAPRTVWALENLTRAVHPEAYEAAQASLEATPTATATSTATETETGGTDTDAPTATPETDDAATDGGTATATDAPATTDGSGPGFGLVTGAIAVLAVALFGRRRQ